MTTSLPRTSFLLIRHAQARAKDGGYRRDTPLSDLGLKQAQSVAEAIGAVSDINAVYSSPFSRACQTAKAIADRIGETFTIVEELSEFTLAESPLEALAARPDLEIWRPEHRGIENGETVEEFFTRVSVFCEQLCRTHRNQRVVLVCHCGTIEAAIRWALGIGESEPWTFELEIPNASITEVEVWPHGRVPQGAPRLAVLVRMGDTRHVSGIKSEI